MTSKNIVLDQALHQYLLDVSLRESDLLRKLRQETADLEMASMQIAPEQGQFMAMLVQLLNAKNALEIGVFTGYSSICIAQALAPGGKLLACDVSDEWTKIAQRYWQQANLQNTIELRLAPALDTLTGLLTEGCNEDFDFIFIDADKNNYMQYYQLSLQLLRPGGLIVVDNVLWSGRVLNSQTNDIDTQAIIEFNQFVHQDKRVDLSMLAVADGLTLIRKKL